MITLGPGEEHGSVDFQLKPVPTFTIAGTVTSADGQVAHLGVRLLPAASADVISDNGLDVSTTITESDGKFTFLGVPAGAYALKILRAPRPVMQEIPAAAPAGPGLGSAPVMNGGPPQRMLPPTDPTLFADVPVSVADADITGLSVPLRMGARVSGRVEFDGTAPKPALDRVPSPVNVYLNPIGVQYFAGPVVPPAVTASGQFTTMSMPPAGYIVSGSAPGWTLKSAMIGGRNISELPLDLRDADVGGLVITFFDRPAQISGVVRNSRGEPVDAAIVFILPTNYRALNEAGSLSGRLRQSRSGTDGKYTAGGLVPGDYLIAASTDNVLDNTDVAKALDALTSAATRVTVGDNEKHVQDLSISAVTIR